MSDYGRMLGLSVISIEEGVKCGKVVEFLEEAIEERQKAIAERHGFTLEDHSLVIYGICPSCREGDANQ